MPSRRNSVPRSATATKQLGQLEQERSATGQRDSPAEGLNSARPRVPGEGRGSVHNRWTSKRSELGRAEAAPLLEQANAACGKLVFEQIVDQGQSRAPCKTGWATTWSKKLRQVAVLVRDGPMSQPRDRISIEGGETTALRPTTSESISL